MAYVLAANLKKGDMVEISLNQVTSRCSTTRKRWREDQAKLLLQAGKRGVPAGGWPEGTYRARGDDHARRQAARCSETSKPMAFE